MEWLDELPNASKVIRVGLQLLMATKGLLPKVETVEDFNARIERLTELTRKKPYDEDLKKSLENVKLLRKYYLRDFVG